MTRQNADASKDTFQDKTWVFLLWDCLLCLKMNNLTSDADQGYVLVKSL